MSRNETLRTEHLVKVATVKKQFGDRMSQLRDENVGSEILITMLKLIPKKQSMLYNELNTGHVSFIRSSIIQLFHDPHLLFGNHLGYDV